MSQFPESHFSTLLKYTDVEREAIVTLANMEAEARAADADENKQDTLKVFDLRVQRMSRLQMNDIQMRSVEAELLPERLGQPVIPRESTIKKSSPQKHTPGKDLSSTKELAIGNAVILHSFQRTDIHTTISVGAKDAIWKVSPLEKKSTSNKPATPNRPVTPNKPAKSSENPYKKEYPQNGRSRRAACPEPAQLPTPDITPPAPIASGIPSTGPTNNGNPSKITLRSFARSSAVNLPRTLPTRAAPGNTYPELITRAIRASANGRIKVPDLYRILPTYNPTIISKLTPSEPSKGKKQKTILEVFQENVRQNLSRNKALFRNIKDPQTGKSTGFWELASGANVANGTLTTTTTTILPSSSTSISSQQSSASSSSSFTQPSSSSSGLKRKLGPNMGAGPSKKAKSAE